MAEAGVASRRAAEDLIREGRVTVDGQVVRLLGSRVRPGQQVCVDGKPVRPRPRLYVALHKPPGYVSTRRPQGRQKGVMELLPAEWQNRLYPVGRLDRATEGLLLLTNDGEFALRLTHPRWGVLKHYLAVVRGRVEPAVAERLVRGLRHRGERLRAESVRILSANNTRSRVRIVLREGRNREVRRMFAACGLEVEHLLRDQIGPLKLGELPAGRWRVLTPAEVRALWNAVGGSRGRDVDSGTARAGKLHGK
ncbi:MAG: rRNA pseudouridine synthase [Verrucomicrobia bacterium]|nr:MAG: rRNA pseudouridine synthase [Verrucomicrobiota bacterium]